MLGLYCKRTRRCDFGVEAPGFKEATRQSPSSSRTVIVNVAGVESVSKVEITRSVEKNEIKLGSGRKTAIKHVSTSDGTEVWSIHSTEDKYRGCALEIGERWQEMIVLNVFGVGRNVEFKRGYQLVVGLAAKNNI